VADSTTLGTKIIRLDDSRKILSNVPCAGLASASLSNPDLSLLLDTYEALICGRWNRSTSTQRRNCRACIRGIFSADFLLFKYQSIFDSPDLESPNLSLLSQELRSERPAQLESFRRSNLTAGCCAIR